jgi:uncharacterized protein YggE
MPAFHLNIRVMSCVVVGAVVLAVAIGMTASDVWAQQPAESQARIIVTGTGSIAAAPDYADIGCGATTKAKTAKEATDANSKIMTAVVAALREAGVEQRDIQTAHFSLQPTYAPPQPNIEPKLTGFSMTNRFSVAVRDMTKLGDILDRLITAGATDIGQVDFQHNDVSKLLDQARSTAMADARRKAALYAQAAGLTLGSVVFVSEDADRPMLFAPKGLMRAAATPVPIAAGEDTLAASVTVGFDVAQK